MPHIAARHPTKYDITDAVNLFPTEYFAGYYKPLHIFDIQSDAVLHRKVH